MAPGETAEQKVQHRSGVSGPRRRGLGTNPRLKLSTKPTFSCVTAENELELHGNNGSEALCLDANSNGIGSLA